MHLSNEYVHYVSGTPNNIAQINVFQEGSKALSQSNMSLANNTTPCEFVGNRLLTVTDHRLNCLTLKPRLDKSIHFSELKSLILNVINDLEKVSSTSMSYFSSHSSKTSKEKDSNKSLSLDTHQNKTGTRGSRRSSSSSGQSCCLTIHVKYVNLKLSKHRDSSHSTSVLTFKTPEIDKMLKFVQILFSQISLIHPRIDLNILMDINVNGLIQLPRSQCSINKSTLQSADSTNIIDQCCCGNFSQQYLSACDLFAIAPREQVIWDINTIYTSRAEKDHDVDDEKEPKTMINVNADFGYLDISDLCALLYALQFNTHFTGLRVGSESIDSKAGIGCLELPYTQSSNLNANQNVIEKFSHPDLFECILGVIRNCPTLTSIQCSALNWKSDHLLSLSKAICDRNDKRRRNKNKSEIQFLSFLSNFDLSQNCFDEGKCVQSFINSILDQQQSENAICLNLSHCSLPFKCLPSIFNINNTTNTESQQTITNLNSPKGSPDKKFFTKNEQKTPKTEQKTSKKSEQTYCVGKVNAVKLTQQTCYKMLNLSFNGNQHTKSSNLNDSSKTYVWKSISQYLKSSHHLTVLNLANMDLGIHVETFFSCLVKSGESKSLVLHHLEYLNVARCLNNSHNSGKKKCHSESSSETCGFTTQPSPTTNGSTTSPSKKSGVTKSSSATEPSTTESTAVSESYIKHFFMQSVRLKYVNLNECKLSVETLKHLLLGISCNTAAVPTNRSCSSFHLVLSGNGPTFFPHGGQQVNGSFQNTDVGKSCSSTFSSVIETCFDFGRSMSSGLHITHLDLSDSQLNITHPSSHLQSLFNALLTSNTTEKTKFHHLKSLDLSRNCADVSSLIGSSNQNGSSVNDLLIDRLTIQDGVVVKPSPNILANFLRFDRCLRELNLSDCKLRVDLYPILNALSSNRSLVYLDIRGNMMGDVGARLLSKALQINVHLEHVNIDKNGLTCIGINDLTHALRYNYTLSHIPYPVHDYQLLLPGKGNGRKFHSSWIVLERRLCLNRNKDFGADFRLKLDRTQNQLDVQLDDNLFKQVQCLVDVDGHEKEINEDVQNLVKTAILLKEETKENESCDNSEWRKMVIQKVASSYTDIKLQKAVKNVYLDHLTYDMIDVKISAKQPKSTVFDRFSKIFDILEDEIKFQVRSQMFNIVNEGLLKAKRHLLNSRANEDLCGGNTALENTINDNFNASKSQQAPHQLASTNASQLKSNLESILADQQNHQNFSRRSMFGGLSSTSSPPCPGSPVFKLSDDIPSTTHLGKSRPRRAKRHPPSRGDELVMGIEQNADNISGCSPLDLSLMNEEDLCKFAAAAATTTPDFVPSSLPMLLSGGRSKFIIQTSDVASENKNLFGKEGEKKSPTTMATVVTATPRSCIKKKAMVSNNDKRTRNANSMDLSEIMLICPPVSSSIHKSAIYTSGSSGEDLLGSSSSLLITSQSSSTSPPSSQTNKGGSEKSADNSSTTTTSCSKMLLTNKLFGSCISGSSSKTQDFRKEDEYESNNDDFNDIVNAHQNNQKNDCIRVDEITSSFDDDTLPITTNGEGGDILSNRNGVITPPAPSFTYNSALLAELKAGMQSSPVKMPQAHTQNKDGVVANTTTTSSNIEICLRSRNSVETSKIVESDENSFPENEDIGGGNGESITTTTFPRLIKLRPNGLQSIQVGTNDSVSVKEDDGDDEEGNQSTPSSLLSVKDRIQMLKNVAICSNKNKTKNVENGNNQRVEITTQQAFNSTSAIENDPRILKLYDDDES